MFVERTRSTSHSTPRVVSPAAARQTRLYSIEVLVSALLRRWPHECSRLRHRIRGAVLRVVATRLATLKMRADVTLRVAYSSASPGTGPARRSRHDQSRCSTHPQVIMLVLLAVRARDDFVRCEPSARPEGLPPPGLAAEHGVNRPEATEIRGDSGSGEACTRPGPPPHRSRHPT